MAKSFFGILIALLLSVSGYSQQYPVFTHADTLRGKLTPERTCYKVYFYDLHLKIDTVNHSITGYNLIAFNVVHNFFRIQVDLFKNMVIDSILNGNYQLHYIRDSNATFINFNSLERKGTKDSIKIYYHGIPQVAKKPPWDGGFVWSHDSTGNFWFGVACEGTGASLWWPCKDHLSDKPDSMRMSFDVPNGLMCISNGRLCNEKNLDNGYTRFTWFVSYPIINYDVTLNIADYAHISDYYVNQKDTLTLDYYVLRYNEQKAQAQFLQVKPMLACYEKYFGKYPFYRDGYKLVETNYWGMEHQSCVSYGNHYRNNPFGFDFIIVHESAHEWWGNSLSCSDPADMWLHEAFATYAESLYLECTPNYKTAIKYLYTQQKKIINKYPVIGPYNVNFQGTNNDNDMYYKGTWMLQTFRHVINNDSLFFAVLKGLQTEFKYSSTNTDEVINFINKTTGKNYTPFFNQYLQRVSPPIFDYKLEQQGNGILLTYRWDSVAEDFTMPIKITSEIKDSVKSFITITPTLKWQTIKLNKLNPSQFSIDLDEFYVIPKKEE
jgi:aminopeptidase N